MLKSFFHLNGTEHAELTQEILLQRLKQEDTIENAVYAETRFAPDRPNNVIVKKTFRNILFKSTHFVGAEFRYCTFEDCLFLGAVFDTCEFHQAHFIGCNPYKSRFQNTYVDPKAFAKLLTPSKHANIGVFLYQQLRYNALSTHQPDFADSADWLFRRWQRYELKYKYEHPDKYKGTADEISGRKYWTQKLISHLFEITAGFGHSFLRFALTSIALFAVIVSVNHWLWSSFDASSQLKQTHPWIGSVYYTAVTLATVGYGDITPNTLPTMMLAAIEAMAGFFWFGILASMLVRRFLR